MLYCLLRCKHTSGRQQFRSTNQELNASKSICKRSAARTCCLLYMLLGASELLNYSSQATSSLRYEIVMAQGRKTNCFHFRAREPHRYGKTNYSVAANHTDIGKSQRNRTRGGDKQIYTRTTQIKKLQEDLPKKGGD